MNFKLGMMDTLDWKLQVNLVPGMAEVSVKMITVEWI